MEGSLIVPLVLVLATLWIIHRLRKERAKGPPVHRREEPSAVSNDRPEPPVQTKPRVAKDTARQIRGRAYVIDGDSIVIQRTEIRLFGVDAPEFNHPFGKKAKWAMVALCKGQDVTAEVVSVDDHGRAVAKCTLPDGRDLSAEMVKQGLAIDWPKFSGGVYGPLEPEGIRKKLWLADARQKGRMHVWKQFEARQAAAKDP